MGISRVFQHSRYNLKAWDSLLSTRNLKVATSLQKSSCLQARDQTLYELRTYSIYPEKMKDFLALTAEELHLRTAHSKLLGYWTSEIGGLNQVVHIWEYDSLSHRSEVRARLANDSQWVGRYLSRVIGMMQQQDNVLLTLLPGTSLNLPSDQGVYELQTLNLEGSPGLWSQTLVERVRAWAGSADSRSRMIGAWRSVLGPTHLAAVLWQHENPDCCLTLRDTIDSLSQKEEMTFHITGGHSKLLLPHAVSNLQ